MCYAADGVAIPTTIAVRWISINIKVEVVSTRVNCTSYTRPISAIIAYPSQRTIRYINIPSPHKVPWSSSSIITSLAITTIKVWGGAVGRTLYMKLFHYNDFW